MSRGALLVLLVIIFGYVGMHLTTTSHNDCTDIKNVNILLTSQLKKVESKWYKLGTELNIEQWALASIEEGEAKVYNRFRSMINMWYNKQTRNSTCWETILNALKAMGEEGLAEDLGNVYGVFKRPVDGVDGMCDDPMEEEGELSEWPFFEKLVPIEPKGKKIVETSKYERGLAVIINCDYNNTDHPLPGTEKDATEMKKTLDVLKFHTIVLHNPSKMDIITEIKVISSALPLLEKVSLNNFKAIMFVFSGHGTDPDKILSQDMKVLDLKADIVKPLIGHRRIKHIPKLFFVDACRGREHLKQAPSKAPIEEEANYRIDYATVPHHYSYMAHNKSQSEWLPTLAYELRTNKDSVQNVVAIVNQKVYNRTYNTHIQQGVCEDRLNVGPLYLHPEFGKDLTSFHTEL